MPDARNDSHREAQPAALPWRLIALVYDLLPLLALWFATAGLVLLARGGEPVTPGSAMAWLELLLLAAVGFLYFGLSWRRGGQTIGMKPWRLTVVRADGRALSWRDALIRYIVAGASLALAGAGFWWSLIDRRRRCWHDLAAGTQMLRAPKRR